MRWQRVSFGSDNIRSNVCNTHGRYFDFSQRSCSFTIADCLTACCVTVELGNVVSFQMIFLCDPVDLHQTRETYRSTQRLIWKNDEKMKRDKRPLAFIYSDICSRLYPYLIVSIILHGSLPSYFKFIILKYLYFWIYFHFFHLNVFNLCAICLC